jgi:hypothetical protein
MRFMKFTSVLILAAGSVASYAQTTTTCTPTFGGGSRCTTTEDPMAQMREQQRQQQQQWQEQTQRQADALRQQQAQQQANRPLCTSYTTNPMTGQVQARTAPCAF